MLMSVTADVVDCAVVGGKFVNLLNYNTPCDLNCINMLATPARLKIVIMAETSRTVLTQTVPRD